MIVPDERRPQIAVGAVVLREGSLLMVKRGRAPAEGLWTIPGGRVRHGEYLADAVRREVKEETGIDVEVGRLLGAFEVRGPEHYVILDHLATAPETTPPVAADDASDARWVPLAEIGALDCTPRLVETLRAWDVLP